MTKNLQWTDLELLDRGIESYPELIITDEIMMDMLFKGNQCKVVRGKNPFLLERNFNMFICPTCRSAFATEEMITKHSLQCWRKHNPNHKSKPAPCKGNITQREMNDDVANFFARLKGE